MRNATLSCVNHLRSFHIIAFTDRLTNKHYLLVEVKLAHDLWTVLWNQSKYHKNVYLLDISEQ